MDRSSLTRDCPFSFSRRGIRTAFWQFGYLQLQKMQEVPKGGQHLPFGSGSSNRGKQHLCWHRVSRSGCQPEMQHPLRTTPFSAFPKPSKKRDRNHCGYGRHKKAAEGVADTALAGIGNKITTGAGRWTRWMWLPRAMTEKGRNFWIYSAVLMNSMVK